MRQRQLTEPHMYQAFVPKNWQDVPGPSRPVTFSLGSLGTMQGQDARGHEKAWAYQPRLTKEEVLAQLLWGKAATVGDDLGRWYHLYWDGKMYPIGIQGVKTAPPDEPHFAIPSRYSDETLYWFFTGWN